MSLYYFPPMHGESPRNQIVIRPPEVGADMSNNVSEIEGISVAFGSERIANARTVVPHARENLRDV
ncbi:MAG: hypothetical protein ACKVIW_07130 [bacterium]